MKIKVEDNLLEPLFKYRKSFTGTMNWVTAEVAKELADFTKVNFLLGQKLRRRTGQLYGSVKFFKSKTLQMGVRPGVGIRGSLNYLNRWNNTSREFMRPSLKQFEQSRMAEKIMQRLVQKNINNQGFK